MSIYIYINVRLANKQYMCIYRSQSERERDRERERERESERERERERERARAMMHSNLGLYLFDVAPLLLKAAAAGDIAAKLDSANKDLAQAFEVRHEIEEQLRTEQRAHLQKLGALEEALSEATLRREELEKELHCLKSEPQESELRLRREALLLREEQDQRTRVCHATCFLHVFLPLQEEKNNVICPF